MSENKNMLEGLKQESNLTFTENGGIAYSSSGTDCLDLFFRAGAMRNVSEDEIKKTVIRAYTESAEKTMKIIFFARDVRGGLGERRFFRTAVETLAHYAPQAVKRNIKYFGEYGRFDDLCVLLDTPCSNEAVEEIKKQLESDIENMKNEKPVSLLAKWLPSVNASSKEAKAMGKKIAKSLGMNDAEYRKTLSSLRKYIDILENYLREKEYTFNYSAQPSNAMLKYRKAFIRNDEERYRNYMESVVKGESKLNTSTLYPYDIIRKCIDKRYLYELSESSDISEEERLALDATWKNLPDYTNGEENMNAIAVVDGSGSMTWCENGNVRPIDVAISLGIYFGERNKGKFANHFITFSRRPRLIEIKGEDIYEKANYCSSFDECSNTDIEAVFKLILNTAVKNKLTPEELPSRIYIISDMEFDYCAEGGNDETVFLAMKKKYAKHGYNLPDIIFWNVNSRNSTIPVTFSETGAALVSGASPSIFNMVMSGEINPEKIMNDIIYSERYAVIS